MSDSEGETARRGGDGKPRIRLNSSDEAWRETRSERLMSDDPEINRLWDLPISELDTILEDEKHPLHEKALAVTAQAFAPLSSAMQEWMKSAGSLSTSIGESLRPHLPNMDQSWVSDLVLEYPEWRTFRNSLPQRAEIEPLVADDIDFDAPSPPAATLAEIASAADDAAVIVLHELLEVQREQLAHAKTDSEANLEALRVARSGRTAGWWAAGAAIAAAVVSIIGIMVTVNVGG